MLVPAVLFSGLLAAALVAAAADTPAAPTPAPSPAGDSTAAPGTTPPAPATPPAPRGNRAGRGGGRGPVAPTADAADASPTPKLPLILVEDFESTPVGKIPYGFTATSGVAVTDDFAHSGKKSLKLSAATSGPRRITLSGDKVTALGGKFWGRIYYRVQQPNPVPGNGVIHSTLVSGNATSPLFNDHIEVRVVDTVMNTMNAHQYIYNVQPGGGRREFGKGSPYLYHYSDNWTLAEWSVDEATQSYHLYINGEEIKGVALDKGAGNYQGVELPKVFTNLMFGWNNYQGAGTGFVAWIDDIALGKERIGPLVTAADKAAAEPAPAAK